MALPRLGPVGTSGLGSSVLVSIDSSSSGVGAEGGSGGGASLRLW